MALTFTVSKKVSAGGGLYRVTGTFTTSNGDRNGTLGASTHGLNYIADWRVDFAQAGLSMPSVKGVPSSGEIALEFGDTRGKSGRFMVLGA